MATDYDRKLSAMEADLDSLKKQRDALKAHGAKIAKVRADAVRKEKQAKLEAFAKAKAELEARERTLRVPSLPTTHRPAAPQKDLPRIFWCCVPIPPGARMFFA